MEKDASKLDHHRLYKKRGILSTPLNDGIGKDLVLSSWSKERMPEYIWLGLILMEYGRAEAFGLIYKIYCAIISKVDTIDQPKLSTIFDLPDEDQIEIYKIITQNIDIECLSPLTILYRTQDHPIFCEYFSRSQFSFEKRLKKLQHAVKLYSPHQSNEATDLRFLAIGILILKEKIIVSEKAKISIDALNEYPHIGHDNKKMEMYRPTIRCMEGMDFINENNKTFCQKFWRDIGMITRCKPVATKYESSNKDCKDFVMQYQKVLDYLIRKNKEELLSDDKFNVILGSITYALKIFIEVNDKSLGNNILGRHAIRSIIEIYVILKYLLKLEPSNGKVWEEYKIYGIGKFKLILLKAREGNIDPSAHVVPPMLDILVNEMMWEEVIDIDLKYFDKQNIKEKSKMVGEKDLYDIYYDYDSNYSHGLWGAVREGAMLHCDLAEHEYHTIPDIYVDQNLPDVQYDCIIMMKKLSQFLNDSYSIPENLISSLFNFSNEK